jgi:uncharacterized membrane protein
MDDFNNGMNLVFRWVHVVAGIAWIGHLYFFNFVNAHFAKTLTADNKKLVVPELLPRALYWFRMGAAWTWITGLLLLGIVYYMGGVLYEDPTNPNHAMGGLMLVLLLVFAFLYDVIMRMMKGQQMVANILALVLLAALYCLCWEFANFSGRALYIFMGGALGTAMAMNVWMRIWPAQKKIITAVKAGTAPDADLVAMAGLRSRHNTYMSVPLVFFMVSNHYPTVYGNDLHWLWAAVIVAVGFLATWLLYKKSAQVPGF